MYLKTPKICLVDGVIEKMNKGLVTAISELEEEVKSHKIYNNPFLRDIGKMSIMDFRNFLIQHYFLSSSFSQAIGIVYGRIPDSVSEESVIPGWVLAKSLIEFMKYEHWGSEETGAHYSLFMEVFSAFGVNLGDLYHATPLPITSDFVSIRRELCINCPILSAVGGLGFMELALETIYMQYLNGAKEIAERNNITIPLQYFEAHVREERGDYEKFKHIFLKLGEGKIVDAPFLIRDGAMTILNARDRWYSTLYSQYSDGRN